MCCPIEIGSMKMRLKYDYENERKMPGRYWDLQQQFRDVLNWDEAWKARVDPTYVFRNPVGIAEDLRIPEHFQLYMDRVELSKAKTQEGRFMILKKLIWSRLINLGLIKEQKISRKQKKLLEEEWNYIDTTWPHR